MKGRSKAFIGGIVTAIFLCAFDTGAWGKRRKPPPRIPSVLRGSVEALAQENRLADANSLPRFNDRAALEKAVADGILTPLLDTDAYAIDGELGEEDPDNAELYANTQAWTRMFLDDVLGEGHKMFGLKFAITSLSRTQEYQDTLRESNAAAADSKSMDSRSTHLTGATVDISLAGIPWRAKQWFRKRLIELEKKGLIQATEERHQYCMHVLVLPGYEKATRPAAP